MKIRNKQTGDVWDIPRMRHPTVQEDDISFFAVRDGDGKLFSYPSIAELNADWEDYASKEPLIKDEKICKAVRVWADENRIEKVGFKLDEGFSPCACYFYDESCEECEFGLKFYLGIEDNKIYTIAELCGEEEE